MCFLYSGSSEEGFCVQKHRSREGPWWGEEKAEGLAEVRGAAEKRTK